MTTFEDQLLNYTTMMTISEIKDYIKNANVKSVSLCRYPVPRRGYFADIEFFNDEKTISSEIMQDTYNYFPKTEEKHVNVYVKKLKHF